MAIDPRTRQILWGRAGATCSFPKCRLHLVRDATSIDREVLVGEIAHIVAQSPEGPRGNFEVPGGNLDGNSNLILLCHKHHELVDQQHHTYSIEHLLQFKKEHEEWVRTRLSKEQELEGLSSSEKTVTEKVFSTLLPISQIPHYVFSGECTVPESEIHSHINWPNNKQILTPHIIRGGNLYAFNNLNDFESPFASVVDPTSAKRHSVIDWLNKPDMTNWYVQLLNRTVNKITGRLGLKLDKDHHRYYFEPKTLGQAQRVSYQSIGGIRSERFVAWNPHFKHNKEPKNYWEHLAVGLRFHKLGPHSWGLTIRPERRFTSDGFSPLVGNVIGKKNTMRKSRMYNFDVLQEVQFWKDFLAQGTPRITCLFGGQSLVIENTLMNASITWPEIVGDQADRMAVKYEDDLFTFAELDEANNYTEFDADVYALEADEELPIED